MSRYKTFDATGIAPGGRLFAGDLNAIQDMKADQANFGQTIDLNALRIGDSSLQIVKFGTGELRATGALRADGLLRGLGGIIAGAFTTTQRDAIALNVGLAPYGTIILNTTTNQYEWNAGSDASRSWRGIGGADPTAYGTSLPGSPVNGQTYTLVDNTTTPTYTWHMKYNSTAGKWYYTGGSPATSLVAGTVQSAAGNNVWSAALTPTFTFPIAGDYDIRATWNAENSAAFAQSDQGFGVNGAPATDEYTVAGGSAAQMYLFIRKTGVVASQTGSFYIRDTDTSRRNGMSRRRFEIVPFRLG